MKNIQPKSDYIHYEYHYPYPTLNPMDYTVDPLNQTDEPLKHQDHPPWPPRWPPRTTRMTPQDPTEDPLDHQDDPPGPLRWPLDPIDDTVPLKQQQCNSALLYLRLFYFSFHAHSCSQFIMHNYDFGNFQFSNDIIMNIMRNQKHDVY